MCAAIASPEKLLSIRFMGLCTFVQDKKEDAEVKKVTVVMPDAANLNEKLCEHRPYLIFKASDWAGTPDDSHPRHRSFVTYDGVFMGVWDLSGLELRVESEHGPLPNQLVIGGEYGRILGFDDLTSGLGTFDGSVLPQAKWPGKVQSAFVLDSGVLDSRRTDDPNPKRYELGVPNGKKWRPANFRQIAQYSYLGSAKDDEVSIVGKPTGGASEVLRFWAGSKLAVTHLCPVGKADADLVHELDVQVAYELSTLSVPVDQRVALRLKKGHKTTPTSDACPPLRAYLS